MSKSASDVKDPKVELTPKAALAELESHAWALRPDVLGALVNMAQEGRLTEAITASMDMEAARRGRPTAIRGGIAQINVKGVLAPVGGLLAMLFDIPDPLETFKTRLLEAMGNEDVGAILLNFDSPGGVVSNIPETAQALKEVRGQGKPIVAIANTQMASAAYWLGSQADEVVVTPSGTAGSIGVYATHQDMTEMAAKDGVKITIVSAGKYKAETHPFVPLTEEAKAHMQEDANTYYEMFLADVAEGRGAATGKKLKVTDVADGFGEGRSLTAQAAVKAGLADRVESLGGTIARLAARQRGGGSPAAEDLAGAALNADEPEGESEDQAEANAGAEDNDELTAEERQLLHDVLA